MNRSLDEIYRADKNANLIVCEEVRDNIEFRAYTKADNEWIEEYNSLNVSDKIDYIRYLLYYQFEHISKRIENLDNPIAIPKLGTLYFKESRLLYKRLVKENPELSEEEIVSMVKQEYWNSITEKVETKEKAKIISKNVIKSIANKK